MRLFVAVLLVVSALGVAFKVKPEWFFEADSKAISTSLERKKGLGDVSCRPSRPDQWYCTAEPDPDTDYPDAFLVGIDDDRCWVARPVGPVAPGEEDLTLDRCLGLLDYLGISP